MRHALAVLLTLLLGVLAHPAAAASRIAAGVDTAALADRGRLGVDDVRRESAIGCGVVALSDEHAEDPEDPEPSLTPARMSMSAERCATSVAPADDGASRIAWRLSTVGARGPPA